MTYLLCESTTHELFSSQESRLLEKLVEVDHLCIQSPSEVVEGILDSIVFCNQVNESAKKKGDVVSKLHTIL